MSEFFIIGEEKERSGIYKRVENISEAQPAGAEIGIGLALVTGTWGALNTPVEIETPGEIPAAIGTGTGADVVNELLSAGVQLVIVCRVGTGGTQATLRLKDTTAETPVEVVQLTAKYPGTRDISISVKESIYDDDTREIDIYDGTTLLETYNVAIGATTSEAKLLCEALANSSYVIATFIADGNKALATVNQVSMAGGVNPTVDTTAYSNAASACEMERWNMCVVDTDNAAVHAVIQAFVDRVYQDGNYPMACFGALSTTTYDARLAISRSFNDAKIHYVFNGWYDASNVLHEGFMAAARIGGRICAIPSNESLTNETVTGAVALSERLTNNQIIKALKAGSIVITKNRNQSIVIEKGINTLVNPSRNEDDGWKKIRRVKERFEMFDRIDRTLEPLRAKIDNDDDGRNIAMAAMLRVLDAMVGEHKLLEGGVVYVDPDNPPKGDSAWFKIGVDDVDSLERIYLTYQLRFAPPTSDTE